MLLPAGDAAAYTFATSSQEFLEANFMPAIFSAVPFTWTEKDQLVGRQLSEAVESQRTQGASFDAIAQQYNEQAARPVVDIIHTRLQLAEQQLRKTAADPLQMLQAAAAAAATPAELGKRSVGTMAAAGSKDQAAAATDTGKAGPSTAKPPLAPGVLSKMKHGLESWLRGGSQSISKGAAATAAAGNTAAGGSHNSSFPAADSPRSSSAAGVSPHSRGSGLASLAPEAGKAAVSGPGADLGSSLAPTAGAGSDEGAAGASSPAEELQRLRLELELLRLDPFDRGGFALKALSSQFAADIYMGHSKRQEPLQIAHMQGLQAGGHISLDHVHQVAKRMQGDFLGTLIACGASGVVLGFWHVHSTSMRDVQQSLKGLRERSMRQHGEVSCLIMQQKSGAPSQLGSSTGCWAMDVWRRWGQYNLPCAWVSEPSSETTTVV